MNIINLVKYPWTAGIIGVMWLGTALLIISDKQLPVLELVVTTMVISSMIALVGFRVER